MANPDVLPAKNVVIVTGPPGSGKTSLAVPLAASIGFPLVAKDSIKEALDSALAPDHRDIAWSRLLGRATYQAMWTISGYFDNLVLESNFLPGNKAHRNQLLRLSSRPVEVYCACPLDVARYRYESRAAVRHPVHVETELSEVRFLQWDRPLGLGPVITVDTTVPLDIDALAAEVLAVLSAA